MHAFVTGAIGWVGSAVVADLLGAGHRVTGFGRSTEKATALAAGVWRLCRERSMTAACGASRLADLV